MRHRPDRRDVGHVVPPSRPYLRHQMRIGGLCRRVQVGVGIIGPGRSEQQPEQRRTGHREIDIAHPRRHQLRPWIGVRLRLMQRLGGEEPAIPLRRQRRQQPLDIAEMMRRGRMADPRPPRHLPQGKRLDPRCGQFRLGRCQQGRAQVAVVVGLSGIVIHGG